MKKHLSFLLAILLLSSQLFAQNKTDGFVTLKGRFTNPIADSVKISYYYDLDLAYIPREYGMKLDAQGNFSFKFPVAQPYTTITIDHGNQTTDIVVAPGYDLVMADDAKNFDSSLSFSGKGAEVENFLAHHYVVYGPMSDYYSIDIKNLFIQESADFKKNLAGAAQKHVDFLEQNKTGIPASFIAYWKAYYQYQNYAAMLSYPTFHEMQKKKSFFLKPEDFTKEDYSVVTDVPGTFNDEWLILTPYNNFVSNYYYYKILALGKEHFTKDTTETQGAIGVKMAYKEMPPKTAEYYVASYIKNAAKYLSLVEIEQALTTFKAHYPQSTYTALLDKRVSIKKKVSTGMPAMDFTINTPEGKQMKLSDLKGKVVYLDFWASWCQPCVQEMARSKTLREHFKDKNVAFVYISVDEQDAAWKKAMEKYELANSINTREDGSFQGKTAVLYGLNGIPSYFLIDRNGKFATNEDLRPSSGDKLVQAIEKLLE